MCKIPVDVSSKVLQADQNASIAKAAELLLNISREASNHMAAKLLQTLRTFKLQPADNKESLSSLEIWLDISRHHTVKELILLEMNGMLHPPASQLRAEMEKSMWCLWKIQKTCFGDRCVCYVWRRHVSAMFSRAVSCAPLAQGPILFPMQTEHTKNMYDAARTGLLCAPDQKLFGMKARFSTLLVLCGCYKSIAT